jgi:hypothetical protein
MNINLDLSSIFSFNNPFYQNNFIYDKLRQCYRPNEKNAKIKFKLDIEEPGLYFFAIKYNSKLRPKLSLELNSSLLSNDLLKHKTETYDKLLNFRQELGPINIKQKENIFNLVSEGIFPDIYQIEIYTYNKESIIKNPYHYKLSDFILIESYNIHGGFYWQLNNYMICCYFCEKFNKIPIVNFTNSLFMNNTVREDFLVIDNSNWFYNYFEQYAKIPYSVYNSLISYPYKKEIDIDMIKSFENNTIENIENNNLHLLNFTRNAFTYMADEFHGKKADYRHIIEKYMIPLPHVKNILSDIKLNFFPKQNPKNKLFGIHYRGTDKIAEHNALEQNPKHHTYEKILNFILKTEENYKNNKDIENIYYVVSSDEKPFIDFLKKNIDSNKLIYYEEGSRSEIKTSGIDTNFTDIPGRNIQIDVNRLTQSQLIKYKNRDTLINNSMHLGHKNMSNYKKGLDSLIDALILEDCDVLFKSKGNFSMFCRLFNKNLDFSYYELNDI